MTDPSVRIKDIQFQECGLMKSKKKPQKIFFSNFDADLAMEKPLKNVSFIFKIGDDLRQDCLVMQMLQIMDDIKAGVQYIFQTSNPMTLALSATGHAAMECVMTNLLEPGRTVLICNSGIWGVRSADMARRQGATVKEITAEAGTNFR